MLHWANVCFYTCAIAQPCRRTNSEAWWKGYAIYIWNWIWNVASAREWDFTRQMVWWHPRVFAVAHLWGNSGLTILCDEVPGGWQNGCGSVGGIVYCCNRLCGTQTTKQQTPNLMKIAQLRDHLFQKNGIIASSGFVWNSSVESCQRNVRLFLR